MERKFRVMSLSSAHVGLTAHTYTSRDACVRASVCVGWVLEHLLTIFLMAALECSAAVAISSNDSDGEK